MYFLYGDKKLTLDEFLESLRSTKSKALLDDNLEQHPEYINVALNDKVIFEKMGGPEGIKIFSSCSLEVCQAVIASNAYQCFDEKIKQEIKTREQNLYTEKCRFAHKAGKQGNRCTII